MKHSKVAVLGDLHFGVRNDAPVFYDYKQKFFDEIFFPILKERGISTVIQLGDLFDRRKFVNYQTLQFYREIFFQKFVDRDIELFSLLGNHDVFYKNTNKLNSPMLLLSDLETRIHIQGDGGVYHWVDENIHMIPWLTADNFDDHYKVIKSAKMERATKKILCGHFEINDFKMDSGMACYHANLTMKDFKNWDLVLSGHFHAPQQNGNILYTGAPFEFTWGDYDKERGFYILDTETLEIEKIINPYRMFYKIFYKDKDKTKEELLDEIDIAQCRNRYVKVVVIEKDNPYYFDMFIDRINKQNPHDVSIVEDYSNMGVEDIQITEEDAESHQDTIEIIRDSVNNMEISRKDDVLSFLTDLYNESINLKDAEDDD